MEIKGNYNTAICHLDVIDEVAHQQIEELCNNKAFKDSKIRIMPDSHAGKGCTIGTTMTLEKDRVVPSFVGVDIGCGVTASKLPEGFDDFELLENIIRKTVPSGTKIHKEPVSELIENGNLLKDILSLRFIQELPSSERGEIYDRTFRSLGTLGSGNHFIEVEQNSNGDLILTVHSGSRSLGNACCTFYQEKALLDEKSLSKIKRKALIKRLKSEGRETEIEAELKKIQNSEGLGYITGQTYKDYLHDMRIIQNYALENRKTMLKRILRELGISNPDIMINSTHNYIDFRDEYDGVPILRKGAISAEKGETIIIPLSMRDGLIIAEGMGNPDWNYSAPHGAGRVLSRKEAREKLTMEEFTKSMEGIKTWSVRPNTIDEAPQAYKNPDSILERILDQTVKNPIFYKPVYNFKAS